MEITKALRLTMTVLLVVLPNRAALGQTTHVTTVVANKAFLNQTGAIPVTTLYAPMASGNYRVSIYSETQVGSDTNAMCASLIWTDNFNSGQSDSGACLNSASFSYGQGSFVLRVKAGTAISFYTTTSFPTIPSYNVYVTIEKL